METITQLVTAVKGALIDIHGIAGLYRVKVRMAYLLTKDPDFPRPVVLGPRCVRYRVDEVLEFLDRRVADRAPEPAQLASPEARSKRAASLAARQAAKKAAVAEPTPKPAKLVKRVRTPAPHPIATPDAASQAMHAMAHVGSPKSKVVG